MATLHVRNVPDDLYEALRDRAEATGNTISGTVVSALAEAMFPDAGPGIFGIGRRRRGRRLGPFERFTPRARAVIVRAQREARELGHNYLGTEHLLLGLFGEGVADRALERLGVSADRVRDEVIRIVGRGDAAPAGSMSLTPRSKKVLELALREALSYGQNHIGSEHLLLAIACEGEGVAAQILVDAGADETAVRVAVADCVYMPGIAPARSEDTFRVIELSGSPADWQEALNAASREGLELVSVQGDATGGRALFRAA